jgi:hypothetical protein
MLLRHRLSRYRYSDKQCRTRANRAAQLATSTNQEKVFIKSL